VRPKYEVKRVLLPPRMFREHQQTVVACCYSMTMMLDQQTVCGADPGCHPNQLTFPCSGYAGSGSAVATASARARSSTARTAPHCRRRRPKYRISSVYSSLCRMSQSSRQMSTVARKEARSSSGAPAFLLALSKQHGWPHVTCAGHAHFSCTEATQSP